jgi:hypothetical protein
VAPRLEALHQGVSRIASTGLPGNVIDAETMVGLPLATSGYDSETVGFGGGIRGGQKGVRRSKSMYRSSLRRWTYRMTMA